MMNHPGDPLLSINRRPNCRTGIVCHRWHEDIGEEAALSTSSLNRSCGRNLLL